jgi:nucleoside-diphosphate-sugar epimerase
MPTQHLIVFGMGYTGLATVRAAAASGMRVTAVSRDPGTVPPLGAVPVVPFAAAGAVLAQATHLLATAPPPGDGGEGEGLDPVLDAHAPAIAAAKGLRWLGYLSTTGVYGDRGGGWVDETTPPAPGQERSQRRLAAEQAWTAFADTRAVDLFRLAGIYGPGRSTFDDLRAGRARRVDKPGHAFGRIHRDDIVAAVLAAVAQDPPPGVRALNLNDDEPVEPARVVEEAARLLGLTPPPLIPFAEIEARMTPMGRSFWAESRRVAAARTQAELGLRWRFPTYREGLRGILAEEAADGPGQQV